MGEHQINVSISGPAASFFLYDAVNRPVDFEGLILGDYQTRIHKEVSDQHDIEGQNRPGITLHEICVRRVIPTGARFSFYDNQISNIEVPRNIKDLLIEENEVLSSTSDKESSKRVQNRPNSTKLGLLGWFSFRRGSERHNQFESAVSKALISSNFSIESPDSNAKTHLFPWPDHGPLYLFASEGSAVGGSSLVLDWCLQMNVYEPTLNRFRPVKLKIQNLGDTTHADYWKLSNCDPVYGLIDQLAPASIDSSIPHKIVGQADNGMKAAKERLKQAYDSMTKKEDCILRSWLKLKEEQPSFRHLSLRCVCYGCAPSDETLSSCMENFNGLVGSVKRSENGDNLLTISSDETKHLNSISWPRNVESTSCLSTPAEIACGIDVDRSISEAAEYNCCSSSENGVKVSGVVSSSPSSISTTSNAYSMSTRNKKRQKPPISSSSSGANSDETPEKAEHERVIQQKNSVIRLNPGPLRVTSSGHHVTKKSKGVDGNDGNDTEPKQPVLTTVRSNTTAAYPSSGTSTGRVISTITPAESVSVQSTIRLPNVGKPPKGRGHFPTNSELTKAVSRPPGFQSEQR